MKLEKTDVAKMSECSCCIARIHHYLRFSDDHLEIEIPMVCHDDYTVSFL